LKKLLNLSVVISPLSVFFVTSVEFWTVKGKE